MARGGGLDALSQLATDRLVVERATGGGDDRAAERVGHVHTRARRQQQLDQLELLRRHGARVPDRDALIEIFSDFYFGGDPQGDPAHWRGFIGDEPLLVEAQLFDDLSASGIRWGFVSGAEPPSARFVLQQRLGLVNPPLIAMGDAPDKPDPTGLIRLADHLAAGEQPELIAYLGDTVADVHTVVHARQQRPDWPWCSLAVAPPHVTERTAYHERLRQAGADHILETSRTVLPLIQSLLHD